MAHQWRDPLVGRDILVGVAIGAALQVFDLAGGIVTLKLGYHLPPRVPDLNQLMGTHFLIARVLNQVFNAVFNALFAVFGMVLLKIVVRRERLAAALAIALMVFTSSQSIFDGGSPLFNLACNAVYVTIIVVVIQRLGMLATMTLFLTTFILSGAVLTMDPSKWFFANAMLLLAIPIALAWLGFYLSRGGEPLFGRRLLD
jgi:hypothetical protein